MSVRGERDGRRRSRGVLAGLLVAVSVAAAACGARRVPLPGDGGTPLADFTQIHAQVSEACSRVRTVQGEFGLSGRAGGQRLRGRVIAGFERPGSMRLEAVAPFGQPGFILAAREATALLLLPRDERVVRGASAAAILGALTGVALAPADLQAVLTGCVVQMPVPSRGRLHANGWASIDVGADAVVYLERRDGWRLRAARRDGWRVDYLEWSGAFPRVVQLRSLDPAVMVELTATLSQLETNIDIDPAAFTVTVPARATEMTLAELQAAGPLGSPE
jgi:outer membrane lipoprotein-sorting protein